MLEKLMNLIGKEVTVEFEACSNCVKIYNQNKLIQENTEKPGRCPNMKIYHQSDRLIQIDENKATFENPYNSNYHGIVLDWIHPERIISVTEC